MYLKSTSGHILGILGTYQAHGVHLRYMYADHICCKYMYSEIYHWYILGTQAHYNYFRYTFGTVGLLRVHPVHLRYCGYIQGTPGTF